MRFSASFLDDIRARVPVSAIVGRKVKLKKAGREWSGLSPFNKEKTPSFFANDAKARWFDFSAGKNGDIFDWLMEVEGLTFNEAVTRLAHDAGISLPKADPEAAKREARRLTIIEVLEEAQRFFQAQLREAWEPRAYLQARKVPHAAVERFDIGWAPEGQNPLKAHLARRGVDPDLALASGLVVGGEDIPVSYDRFRNRVMVPIRDLAGKIVGFGGRGLGDTQPKYLNSPETDAFHKGSILYNADKARQPAHDGAPVVVVEGYFDVIQSVEAGCPATVGTMGTALTETNMLGLWRLSDTPVLCFDGDSAGLRARAKAISVAFPLLRPGRSLRFAALPRGFDPDKLVRERGTATYRQAVERYSGLADTFWRVMTEGRSLASPEARAKLEADMLAEIGKIPDAQLRRKYERDAKDRIYRLGRPQMIVRANGYSNHSTAPGSIRLTKGLDEPDGFSLKEAVILAQLVHSPKAADPDKIGDRGVSDRTKAVLSEIFYLIGTVPEEELHTALHAGKIGQAVEEAMAVVHGAGITSYD